MHAAFCQFYCALIILFCVVGLTIETGGVLLGQEMQKDKLKDDLVKDDLKDSIIHCRGPILI